MKPTTNKYWYIHWWYLFYLLDKSSHEFAVDKIWECLTANVNIYYHDVVLPSDVENIKIKHEEIYKTKSSVLIESRLYVKNKLHTTATFTFIKIKHERKD